jgi:hypothetical protein
VSRALARRLARVEAAAAATRAEEAAAGAAAGEGALERLERRLDELAARTRACRGDGPLTPEEEAGAPIALLLAWWPGISAAAEARLRAVLAGVAARHRPGPLT